ncbi:MAG: ribonuclease HI [Polyangiaceae bacterium]|nr:ribonuclease HI [Polyangiaceae bacterium]
MPWVRAKLRGQVVYARADAAGALKVESGRVEIRYKPNDGRRYEARADNLEITDPKPLPDETCGAAEPVQKADKAAGAPGGRGGAARSGGAAGGGGAAGPPPPPPSDAIIVYADGACSGNPGPAGLGVVIIDGGGRIELSEYLGQATNHIAELTAILRALEEVADAERHVLIHTDSQYSIGVLQKGWKAKANTELVASLRSALGARRRTRLIYVPGHSGVLLNERADALAREAVQNRASKRMVYPKAAPGKLAASS